MSQKTNLYNYWFNYINKSMLKLYLPNMIVLILIEPMAASNDLLKNSYDSCKKWYILDTENQTNTYILMNNSLLLLSLLASKCTKNNYMVRFILYYLDNSSIYIYIEEMQRIVLHKLVGINCFTIVENLSHEWCDAA